MRTEVSETLITDQYGVFVVTVTTDWNRIMETGEALRPGESSVDHAAVKVEVKRRYYWRPKS
jgi:hypothetical protein